MKRKKIKFKKIKNKKGFSLVELLAVVVILGLIAAIGIGATAYLSDLAKKNKMESQKNTVTMSAESYLQNNKNLVPKIIGETTVIKVSDLRSTNYLTEDIKNSKGESCMEKSYVRVYKLSNTEYTYTTFLYCGNEEVPEDEVVPLPQVSAKFSDSSGLVEDDLLNNVSDAYLYIQIEAGTEDQIAAYKSQGTQLAIDGYSFKIFVYKGSKKTEAYNSGSLSGGREEKIIINKKLTDYIDVTDVTEVSIEVIAINTLGGITNVDTTVGEHNTESEKSAYDDNVKPKCVKPDSPYNEGDWLNKSEYNATKDQRKLTVGCDDGTGSGCIRNYFTMSWPNDDDKYGAEYVYIEVKDNAGNISEHNEDCLFRVNVDIKTPEASVTAYSGQPSTSTRIPLVSATPTPIVTQGSSSGVSTNATTGFAPTIGGGTSVGFAPTNPTHILANKIVGQASILSKSINVNDSKTTASIATTDYQKLTANTTDVKWMNKANYPDGVVYRIDLKDNIRLDRWTWETNVGYVNDTKSTNYKAVSVNNPDGDSGVIAQDAAHGMTIFHGSTTETIFVQFVTEGMRYGVFTVYDKAGNSTKITISANLDRTPPPVPNNLEAYVYNKVRTEGTSVSNTSYSFGTWTNKYVQVRTVAGQNHDKLTNNTTLSGFWEFRYYALNNGGTRVGSSPYKTYTSGKGVYDFKGAASAVDGKNKVRFMGCDKAGNCSEWGNYKDVWIDITIPVCTVEKSITSGAESSYNWLGIGETARVTAYCNDPSSTLASGCTVGNFYHDYNYQINTQKAGANGNGKGGSFTDYAGNTVNCSASERIQIDYESPKCSVSGGSSAWTNKSRTVTGTCSDTGGSGCVGNISHTYSTDTNTTSGGAVGVNSGGSVKDKADNVVSCAANQTVKVDVTMPYVSVDPAPAVYNIDKPGRLDVTITCHDSLSGLSSKFDKDYSVSYMSPVTGFYIGKCCADNAGNEQCYTRGEYSAKTYGRHPDCGVELYYGCRTSGCGVETYKKCQNSACGSYNCNCKTVCTLRECEWCRVGRCGLQRQASCSGIPGLISDKCASSEQQCSTCYYSCRTSGCGVETYKWCRNSACGIERYKECWHYGLDQDIATH